MLLTGLYQPNRGNDFTLDGQPIAAGQPEDYRKLLRRSPMWLFDRSAGAAGETRQSRALVEKWLST